MDPKVQDLKRKTLKTLRAVMRNLTLLRRITGVNELESLGALIGEVSRLQSPGTVTDPRLEQAIERGVSVRQKLVADEGGSLSAEEAAMELGMSKVAVLKRYQKGQLLAWRVERQKAVRFPAWQFKDGKVLSGLEEIIGKLNEASRLDDFGRMLFFLSNSRFLGGKRPLDCLGDGEVHKVRLAAENYGK